MSSATWRRRYARRGMVFGVSSHRVEHWWFMNGGRNFPSDVQDPAYADFYGPAMLHDAGQDDHALDNTPWPSAEYLEDWLARTCELVDKYQPQLVWFDWWIGHAALEPYLQRFAAYYYNRGLEWGKGVAINYKYVAYPEGTAVLDVERGQLKDTRTQLWQNDTSVSKNSWCYVKEQDYKTAESLIHDLVDVVSKNGALLLNIGPTRRWHDPRARTGDLARNRALAGGERGSCLWDTTVACLR